jgi:hypothetical protein
LSVILLAAVYGAINLTYRLSTAGREQMEQAQLVRALFQQMEADIRSVVFRVQEEVASESGEAAAEDEGTEGEEAEIEEGEEEVVIEETTTEDALTNGSEGVFGDAQAFVLHISRPSRASGVTAIDANAQQLGGSDLAAVNYFLAVRGASGLPGTVAQMAYEGSLLNAPRIGTVSGLTRLQGDLMAVQQANESGDIATLASAAEILAPEVVSLSFAYWDGVEWWESWDSVANGALPAAIEITLGIDTSGKDADGVGGNALSDRILTTSTVNDAQPRYFRHVVALPLAEPYVGELSQ